MRALWKAGGNKALYSGVLGNLAGDDCSTLVSVSHGDTAKHNTLSS